MKTQYLNWNPNESTRHTLAYINDVISYYVDRGYKLTLRQIYYRLVARDVIPNTKESYDRIGRIVANARDAGLIDWDSIEDRTRGMRTLLTWADPEDMKKTAYNAYRIDKWAGQDFRLFVWVEKQALSGVIARACEDEGVQVSYISCRGYMSASTIHEEGLKIYKIYDESGQVPVILHLADHDPSGLDMTRDNIERLQLYSDLDWTEYPQPELRNFSFQRIALNMDQIEKYNPPPDPAKFKDSRYEEYVFHHGYNSWELDSLDPDIIVRLIKKHINKYKDTQLWDERVKQEEQDKKRLKKELNL